MAVVKFSGYCPFNSFQDNYYSDLGFLDPEPIFTSLDKKITKNLYFKCPAYLNFISSLFVIRSTPNLKFICNNESNKIHVIDDYTSQFYNSENYYSRWVINRQKDLDFENRKKQFLFSITNYFLFYSKSNVQLTMLPPFLHDLELYSKVNIIPGSFNISKWVRPVEVALQTKKENEEIDIKRGDILCYIQLTNLDDPFDKIKLEKMTEEEYRKITKISKVCTGFKDIFQPLTPLKTLYKLFKEKIKL